MRFIKIPRKFLTLKEGTKFIDVLVYAAIAFQTDSETNKARIGIRTISEKYKVSKQKVEESIDRLKKNGYISYTKLPSANNEYMFNEYMFPETKDFLMLKPDLLTEALKPKDRGILIYLQLAAEPGLNTIAETTIEGLAKRIGVTRQTMSKYYKLFDKNEYLWKDKYYHTKYLVGGCVERPEKLNIIL